MLEDNLRVPSGVSYMIENRETMMHMFPELFEQNRVRPVSHYPLQLFRSLTECLEAIGIQNPTVSLLTLVSIILHILNMRFLQMKWVSN